MKWFKELVARIFLGKKVTKSFNVKDAVATVHMDDGQTRTISRRGTLDSFRSEVYGDDGRELLEHYMSHSKCHILKADDGTLLPTCRIAKIEISETERLEEHTYRDGGIL